MRMVGGTGIIGQDMVCGFEKKGFKPIWEVGYIDSHTGEDLKWYTSKMSTKNHFECKENTRYKISFNVLDGYLDIYFYDDERGFISKTLRNKVSIITTPIKCQYIRFTVEKNSVDTLNLKIKKVS